MSYYSDETSIEDGQPIELYLFTYNNSMYEYTSYKYQKSAYIDGSFHTFNPEFIKRGDTLKLGTSSGSIETCTITVSRTNSVALLYQGAPPELSSVRVKIYRVHGTVSSEYIKIIDGTVSQVRFLDSTAELTITIENILTRNIPRGSLSFFCQNCIYDFRCGLNADDFGIKCYVDINMEGLSIWSTNLQSVPSGYFTDGYIRMGNSVRAVTKHTADRIDIKYPINESDISASFIAYPGCGNTFGVCARRFHNTDNFSGIPYVKPYNVYDHDADNRRAYWESGNIVKYDTGGYYH